MGSLQEMRVQQVRDLNSTVFLGIATGFFLLAPKKRVRAVMTDPVLRATSYFALASSVCHGAPSKFGALVLRIPSNFISVHFA